MTITDFGTTATGHTVHGITLQNGDLTATLLTLGAIVQSVRLRGVGHDLTLGSDDLSDYEGKMHYHGAVIAPVVNRLTNAAAPIAGTLHRFEANQDNLHILHSGSTGAHRQIWTIAEASATHATLTLTLPDGAGGFPGTRNVTATFALDGATLRLSILATTDKPTLFNTANHSYWNLDGSMEWSGHTLQIQADHYLPTDDAIIPTGEIRAVAGTAFDLRTARAITPGAPAFDTCFCFATAQRTLTDVLTLTGKSGLTMTVATTEPGIQIFDDRPIYRALAIEAQGWPDAPNHPGFPGIELHPGQTYNQTTEWRFAAP